MAISLNDEYSKKQTEKKLSELEETLAKEYSTAWQELSKKTKDYFEEFEKRDEAYHEGLLNGSIQPYPGMTVEQHYAAWRMAQIGRGKRWETMRDQMADRMVSANQVAASYINDTTPGIASLNHNYSCYQIEQATDLGNGVSGGVSFSLVNEDTIRNLMEGNNQSEFKVSDGEGGYTFRRNMVNTTADYNWNSKRIQTALTQGILQGESIPKITKRFMDVMESNHKAAVRNARTSVTSAQNAGTMQAYKEAKAMGINLQIEWMATRDHRTRDSHAELDGVRIEEGEKFPNGLRYPGDPDGRPSEVYNCRCTTKGVIDGINDEKKLSAVPGHEGYHSKETYNRWMNRKQKEYDLKQIKALSGLSRSSERANSPNIISEEEYQKIRAIITDTYGIQISEDVDKLDHTLVGRSMQGIIDAIDKLPGLNGTLKKITTYSDGMMASHYDTIFFDINDYAEGKLKETEREITYYSEKKQWHKNATVESVAFHECAHSFEWALIKSSPTEVNEITYKKSWKTCKYSSKVISDAYAMCKDDEEYRGMNQESVIKKISKYATMTNSEAFAEAFADVYANGENAEKISKVIYNKAEYLYNRFIGGWFS